MEDSRDRLSQSFWALMPLIFSGGLEDAYSYFARGGVFANAQTGNVVLLGASIVGGNYSSIMTYLIPLVFFALGSMMAKTISLLVGEDRLIYWKQVILLLETFALMGAAFIPQDANIYANALVSFACSMQVLSFDRIHNAEFASTMCIGNIVKMSSSLVTAMVKKDSSALKRFFLYLMVIVIFTIGACVGYLFVNIFSNYAILFSAGLTLSTSLMFFVMGIHRPTCQSQQ